MQSVIIAVHFICFPFNIAIPLCEDIPRGVFKSRVLAKIMEDLK